MSMRARVLRAVGAHSFGMALTIAIQLLSLPLFLSLWDARTYGIWLMLSAVPSYLAMSDVGMVTVAGNRMMMALGRGDACEANRVFQSAQVFMAGTCLVACLAVTLLVWWLPMPSGQVADGRAAVLMLSLAVLMALFGGLSEQVYRATSRSASAALAGNLCRLVEWLGSIGGLLLGGSFAAVALGALLGRAGGVLYTMHHCRSGSQGLCWGWRAADRDEIRAMVGPAFALMSFPVVNALSFQGVTLVVGATLGAATVAMFNAYRTLARTAVQASGVLSFSVWPEFSRLSGQGDQAGLRRLFLRTLALTTAVSLVISAALYLLAPALLRLWSHGRIAFDQAAMALMLIYAAIGGIWHAPRVLLQATNAHAGLAAWSLPVAVALVLLSFVLGRGWGVDGVSLAMLFTEALLAALAFVFARRLLARRVDLQEKPAS
ncbi:MAG: hypothetical protein DI603_05095 [Roseateles depolymerans]|uniref:Polysaccharide biosynthesis protein n=1 Tax=Roseateles depolymerans TaxID=76731 RepID=A0A2W5DUI7_9BURK|nr:MAG: hypothetical protein DI603_05095 [Roseateles depolymerans]